VDQVGTFAVECYSPAIDRKAVEDAAARTIGLTAERRGRSDPVEYLGAVLVPGDEMVFYLFRSASAAAVREVSAGAGLEFERVLESELIGPGLRLEPPYTPPGVRKIDQPGDDKRGRRLDAAPTEGPRATTNQEERS
jgi:hypothetical protein